MTVKASQAWEISEIIISNEGNHYLLLEPPGEHDKMVHGVSRKGQLVLSLAEARELVFELHSAITQYEELEDITQAEAGCAACEVQAASGSDYDREHTCRYEIEPESIAVREITGVGVRKEDDTNLCSGFGFKDLDSEPFYCPKQTAVQAVCTHVAEDRLCEKCNPVVVVKDEPIRVTSGEAIHLQSLNDALEVRRSQKLVTLEPSEADQARFMEYLGSHGYYYCSNEEQTKLAQAMCALGKAMPASSVPSLTDRAVFLLQHYYVPVGTIHLPSVVYRSIASS
jgi:hypothetical protein